MSKELAKIDIIHNSLINSPVLSEILGKGKDKYILSVLNEIKKTKGDDKKDLTTCTPESIVMAVKTACDLNLEIDSRQHCHIVKYGQVANLQIGYRGFIYSIKKFYPDANIDVQMVYDGDEFKIIKEGDVTTYSLTRLNPFASQNDIIGGFCYISYTLGNRLVSFCETMSKSEILKIRSKAKQDFIWKEWFEEKAKVAIIRRACKIHFSGLQEITNITDYDNQEYELKEVEGVEAECKEEETITSEQGLQIERLGQKAGVSNNVICKKIGVNSFLEIPASKFDSIIKKLQITIETNAKKEVETGEVNDNS